MTQSLKNRENLNTDLHDSERNTENEMKMKKNENV